MDRNQFESYLKEDNVTEKFLHMEKGELQNAFGEEFLKTVDYGDQNNNSHQYDLFEHILRTVDNVGTQNLNEEDLLKVKIAAFFHDIGKPSVAQLNEKTWQTQFIGHAKESAILAEEILANLGYSKNEINELSFLIKCHDDFINISKIEDVTPNRVAKVFASINKKTEEYPPKLSDMKKLIALCEADAMAQNDVIMKNGEIFDTKQNRIARLEAINQVLEEAVVLKQNQEIEKMQKQIETIENGPKPIEKNGKIVNQKQIDLWNAKTEEQKQSEINEINNKIQLAEEEKARILENEDNKEKQDSKHKEKAERLTTSMEESKKLGEEIKELSKDNEQNK